MIQQRLTSLPHVLYKKGLEQRLAAKGRKGIQSEYIDIQKYAGAHQRRSEEQDSYIRSYQGAERLRGFSEEEIPCRATVFRLSSLSCDLALSWDDRLFSGEEIDRLTEKISGILPRSFPEHSLLRDSFLYWDQEDPSRIVFRYYRGEEIVSVSASRFAMDIKAMAACLLSRGLAGKRTGLFGITDYPCLVSFFAISGIGGTAVLLNPDLPADMIRSLLYGLDLAAAMGPDSCLDRLGDEQILPLCFEKFDDLLMEGRTAVRGGSDPWTACPIDPESLAAILFTSGTTGSGKAVGLSHKNFMTAARATQEELEILDTELHHLPFYHIACLTSLIVTFTYGSTGLLLSDYRLLMPALLTQSIQWTSFVPRLADMLLLWLKQNGTDVREKVPDFALQSIFILGSKPNIDYKQEFEPYGIEVVDIYGMTETCGAALLDGIPLKTLSLKTDSGGPVGELLLKGPSIFGGYLGDPQGSRQVFQDGWFCTGDVVRIDREGRFHIIGRTKNILILSNGENVSPEEIETRLLRSDLIEEVRVFESENRLAAEIYPCEALRSRGDEAGSKSAIEAEVDRLCRELPASMQIRSVLISGKPLEKNALGKLIRPDS